VRNCLYSQFVERGVLPEERLLECDEDISLNSKKFWEELVMLTSDEYFPSNAINFMVRLANP
jgi:hypothetical protein